jgi:competence protein ComEC
MPLAPLAIAFAAGILLAPWVAPVGVWAAWAMAVAGGGVLVACSRVAWATVPLVLGVAALGAIRALPPPLPWDHVARLPLPVAGRVEARLGGEPTRWSGERTRLPLEVERVDGATRTGKLLATLYGPLAPLTTGQRIRAELRLRRASGFRNPGVFDYGARLAREQIHVVATGRADRVAPLDDQAPAWPVAIRRRALAAIGAALPPASAALLGGLLIGERTDLPRDIDEGFRRAGVYHVLAVSGFNVALLASSVFALLLAARAGRRIAALAAMLVVVGFALVAGPTPSVLRASIMGVLVLGAILLERDAAVLNSLALAALAILAARPADLLDPGFQLSFAATTGIVLAPLPRGVLPGAVGVSVAAQLAVLPITLSHFNQVSTIGALANLAVVPMAGVATVLGVTAVALDLLGTWAGVVLFDAVWPILIALRAVVAIAASVPGAVVFLPAPPAAAVVAYAAALGLALGAWRYREDPGRWPGLAGAAAIALSLAVIVAAWPLLRAADGLLRVSVLDVGQGDAIVVETPDGHAVLIDAGPGGPMRLDAGERVVAPFLWSRGHLRLAGTLTTHADADHAGGMAAVHRLFSVAETWDANAPRRERWFGGASITTWNRPGGLASAAVARNEAAAIVRVELGLVSFLLASDITAVTERELLRAGGPLGATVLKVAHHGSLTSSTPGFLRAVRPLVAVISVGASNPHRHPRAETLARLTEVGAVVHRTDRDGAVLFATNGRWLAVTRWASGRGERYCLDPDTIC